MFALLILLLFAMSLSGLADNPCKLLDCASRCATNMTDTNCKDGNWNCLCFADIFLNSFRQCVSESCAEKESGGASCFLENQCAIYGVTLTVVGYNTATPIPVFIDNGSTTSTGSTISTLYGNTSIESHTHSSTTSTAPTLSKTPPKTTVVSPDSSTGTFSASTPPAATATSESGASKSYKVVLGAMAAVGAYLAGL